MNFESEMQPLRSQSSGQEICVGSGLDQKEGGGGDCEERCSEPKGCQSSSWTSHDRYYEMQVLPVLSTLL